MSIHTPVAGTKCKAVNQSKHNSHTAPPNPETTFCIGSFGTELQQYKGGMVGGGRGSLEWGRHFKKGLIMYLFVTMREGQRSVDQDGGLFLTLTID